MPNNLLANKKQACVALQTKTFAELGIDNSTKINKIFITDGTAPLNAYDPLSAFNGINSFVTGKGYEIIPKVDLDLTEIVSPPSPIIGVSTLGEDI